jgi:hypothetical protein
MTLKEALQAFRARAMFHEEDKLQAVVEAAQREERLRIYAVLPRCPSCNGQTVSAGIVGEHYVCTNFEWHAIRGAIDELIIRGFDALTAKGLAPDVKT